MDSAKNVLQSIVLATQQVRNATAQYSTVKGVRRVRQHSLIRLESEFQTIFNASRAILEVLDDPLLCHQYMLDDRLVDWLSGTEPETCLDALREMERTLSIAHHGDAQGFSGFTPTRRACDEDDLNTAIVLFQAHKAHFHFLLTTDIWNRGHQPEVHSQTVPSRKGESIQGHGKPQVNLVKDITMEKQRKEIISQKLKKLLKLLDRLDSSAKHRETSSMRQSDTCMWLPATSAYKRWREGKGSFLWLQGKAGAGKSVLAASVIDDINNTMRDGELLAYFYCDFRTKRSTSAVEVMRSILAQLIAGFCALVVDPEQLLDELLKESDTRVECLYGIKELSRYVSKVAMLCPQTPILVIDALDECREIECLLDGLILSSGDVQIFATCRPLQNIISILTPFPCISMDKMASELSADILLHVTRELDSRRRLRTFNEKLKAEICSKLCSKADGMFRWVQCQIDTLEKCSSVAEIRRVLDSLPEGLEETYRRILIAIDRRLSDARLVRRALVWLVTALRPLSMRELLEALMINPEYRALDSRFGLMKGADLLDVCRSLVVHHEETDIITLSHMSVKEYLVGELVRTKLPRYHIVLEDTHERLARLCLAYIAFCLEEIKESRRRSTPLSLEQDLRLATSYATRPFLRYVLSNGFSHLALLGPRNTGIFNDIEALQMITRRCAWEWDRICKLVPSMRSEIPWPASEHDFTLYTLIAFASNSLFQVYLDSNSFRPRDGTNPLVYAAHFGKTGHASLLISHGADVNLQGLAIDGLDNDCSDVDSTGSDEWDGGTSDSDDMDVCGSGDHGAFPLEVAVDQWQAEMVDLLLAGGSAVPARLFARVLGERPHDFPLYIIRRLLQTAGFEQWAATPWDSRPLLEALADEAEDHEEVGLTSAIRKLVRVGCAETLLLIAVKKGCIPVIRTLFSVEASSSTSHPNAFANALAANGNSPLHVAMKLIDEDQSLVITKLLVMGGCLPYQFNADDKPPIHLAVARGFLSVAEYLLARDVRLPSKILFTALQVTPSKRVEMIHLLIRNGANVHVLNSDGDTLLHTVMRSLDRSTRLEIAEILVDAGCDPLAHNRRGETPLHIVAKQRHFEVVNYLVLFSTPSDIHPLMQIDSSIQTPATRSLIGNADCLHFNMEDESRVFAAIKGFLFERDKCLELAECFVSAAGNLFARSSAGAMLYHIAVRQEFTRVMEYLVSVGVPLPSGILFTALQHRPQIVPFLVSAGANVHDQEDNGDTLLHVSISKLSESRCCPMVKLFVEAGCPISVPNAAGVQPIQFAVSRGFTSVVNCLLSRSLRAQVPLPPDLLFTALQLRDPSSIVHLLVSHGANVLYRTPDGDHLLHVVLRSPLEEAVCLHLTQMLVEANCDPTALDAHGYIPLHAAIHKRLASVVEYLLSRDVPFPSDILFDALIAQPIRSGTRETADWMSILTMLVQKGANLDIQDASGNTLIHDAMKLVTETLCLNAIKILVDAGCSFSSMPNFEGILPIQMAIDRGMTTVVEYLLSRGASFPPNILLAALKGKAFHKEVLWMVSTLVKHGADATVLASNGDTMLHVALAYEKKWFKNDVSCLLDVLRCLVRAGCDIEARNAKGRTPFEVAMATGYLDVAECLRRPIVKEPTSFTGCHQQ